MLNCTIYCGYHSEIIYSFPTKIFKLIPIGTHDLCSRAQSKEEFKTYASDYFKNYTEFANTICLNTLFERLLRQGALGELTLKENHTNILGQYDGLNVRSVATTDWLKISRMQQLQQQARALLESLDKTEFEQGRTIYSQAKAIGNELEGTVFKSKYDFRTEWVELDELIRIAQQQEFLSFENQIGGNTLSYQDGKEYFE